MFAAVKAAFTCCTWNSESQVAHNFLTWFATVWLKVQNRAVTCKGGAQTGLNTEGDGGNKDEDEKADTAHIARDRQTDNQREGVERRVEQRTPNVIQHSSHGVQGRKERDQKESKKGREG